ncbi:hypothetical protein MPR_2353 [Myroides profundi]|nr:hypothetical protein MPR_2353 [Myroides profundi]
MGDTTLNYTFMKKNIFFTVLFILFISKIEASNFKTDFLYSRSFNSITTLPINVIEND